MDPKKMCCFLILIPALLSLPLAFSGNDSGMSVGASSTLTVSLFVLVVFLSQSATLYMALSKRLHSHVLDPKRFLLAASLVPVIATITSDSPLLDDDLYRYLWDGFVGSLGINPFEHSPSEGLLGFSETVKTRISYQNVSSVYPPVAQWVFTTFWKLFGDNIHLWKFGFAALTMLTLLIYLHLALFYRVSRPFIWLLLYQVIFLKEFADSCHIDVLGLLFLGLTLATLIQSQKTLGLILAGFFAGCACLVKPLAGIIVLLLPNITFKKKILLGTQCCFFAFLMMAGYFDSLEQFLRYIENLQYFQKNWVFNPGVAELIHHLFEWFDPTHVWQKTISVIGAASVFLAIFGSIMQLYKPRSSAMIALFTLGSIIVIQGLVNSWYIYWLWPFLLLLPWSTKAKKVEFIALPWIVLPSFVAIGGYPFWINLSDLAFMRYMAWTLWFVLAAVAWKHARRPLAS